MLCFHAPTSHLTVGMVVVREDDDPEGLDSDVCGSDHIFVAVRGHLMDLSVELMVVVFVVVVSDCSGACVSVAPFEKPDADG